jgi:hypothetical protein
VLDRLIDFHIDYLRAVAFADWPGNKRIESMRKPSGTALRARVPHRMLYK